MGEYWCLDIEKKALVRKTLFKRVCFKNASEDDVDHQRHPTTEDTHRGVWHSGKGNTQRCEVRCGGAGGLLGHDRPHIWKVAALQDLDDRISTTGDDPDDDDWAVTVSHRCLVDEDQRSMTVVNDLLNLPNKIAAKVLRHPVVKTFIERRWKRTRSIFLVSFFLYLTFVLLFSSF